MANHVAEISSQEYVSTQVLEVGKSIRLGRKFANLDKRVSKAHFEVEAKLLEEGGCVVELKRLGKNPMYLIRGDQRPESIIKDKKYILRDKDIFTLLYPNRHKFEVKINNKSHHFEYKKRKRKSYSEHSAEEGQEESGKKRSKYPGAILKSVEKSGKSGNSDEKSGKTTNPATPTKTANLDTNSAKTAHSDEKSTKIMNPVTPTKLANSSNSDEKPAKTANTAKLANSDKKSGITANSDTNSAKLANSVEADSVEISGNPVKTVKCSLCLDDIKIDFIQNLSCGDEFCRECLTQFFDERINSKSFPILCPNLPCRKEIPETDFHNILSPEALKKIRAIFSRSS